MAKKEYGPSFLLPPQNIRVVSSIKQCLPLTGLKTDDLLQMTDIRIGGPPAHCARARFKHTRSTAIVVPPALHGRWILPEPSAESHLRCLNNTEFFLNQATGYIYHNSRDRTNPTPNSKRNL